MKMKSVIAGRVHRAAGAGAHDQADLRHHAAGHHVALEDLGIAAQRGHAFLDARAAAVVQADDRRADLHRLVHHLADLLGVRFAQRAAEDGEVLAEHEDQAAVDHAVAGDDAVAGDLVVGHAEVGAAVLDEHVPLFEAAFVEQQFQPLARGELALGVLASMRFCRRRPGGPRRACFSSCSMMSCMGCLLVLGIGFSSSGRAAGAPPPRRPAAGAHLVGDVAGSAARTAGCCAEALAQAGLDAFPHPGLVLRWRRGLPAAAGRLQFAEARHGRPRTRPGPCPSAR
jgi:hypothetical protein